MSKFIKYLAILLLAMVVFSCKKASVTDCFKSTGPIVTEERAITGFHTLVLCDNVNLVLKSSNRNALTMEAGEHLLKKIVTEVDDSVLSIRNNNSCNWIRNYDIPVIAYLEFAKLDTLEYRSIGDVTSADTVRTEELVIDIKEGAGEIGFTISATTLYCNLHYGTADFKMKGICNVCYDYSNSFGLIDNRELLSDFVYLNNRGSNDVYVHAGKTLGVTIENIGNVYYTGTPTDISLNRTGTGELIKLDD